MTGHCNAGLVLRTGLWCPVQEPPAAGLFQRLQPSLQYVHARSLPYVTNGAIGLRRSRTPDVVRLRCMFQDDDDRDLGRALDGPIWRRLRARFASGRASAPITLSAEEAGLVTTALAEVRLLVVGSLDALDESALAHTPAGANIEAGLQDAAAIPRHLAQPVPPRSK